MKPDYSGEQPCSKHPVAFARWPPSVSSDSCANHVQYVRARRSQGAGSAFNRKLKLLSLQDDSVKCRVTACADGESHEPSRAKLQEMLKKKKNGRLEKWVLPILRKSDPSNSDRLLPCIIFAKPPLSLLTTHHLEVSFCRKVGVLLPSAVDDFRK